VPKALVKAVLGAARVSEARDSSGEFAPPRPVCGKKRTLTAEQVEQLVEGYRNGATMKELGRQLGVHRVTVSVLVKRAEVPVRNVSLDESQRPEIARLRDEGWTYFRLGERDGVDPATVRRFHIKDPAS
jgi:IS30 family transposase